MTTQPLESKIETYLKNQIRAIGGLCYKFKSTVNGVPDQLIIYDGHMYLVEVKRPNETPRLDQQHVHKQIAKRGVTVYTVSTYQEIDHFINHTLQADIPKQIPKTNNTTIRDMSVFKITNESD